MIRGVDVSAFQPKVRWDEVRAAGAEFAIIKLTDGNHYVNPHAEEQLAGALAVGMWPLLYHFAEPNGPNWLDDAIAEASRLDELADSLEQRFGDMLFCFLDIERNTKLTDLERPVWRDWVRGFGDWSRESGMRGTGFYSYKDFLVSLDLPAEYSNHLLWLARYPTPFRRDPSVYGTWPTGFGPWKRADIWQDGGDANAATWPGIDGPADVDCFAGSLDELRDLCSVSL